MVSPPRITSNQDDSSAPMPFSDHQLEAAAGRILSKRNSHDRYAFVIGSPKQGKTTKLPEILSRWQTGTSPSSVLCIQPSDAIARYYGIKKEKCSSTVKRYYLSDEDENVCLPHGQHPRPGVTYASYRWLFRSCVSSPPTTEHQPKTKTNLNIRDGPPSFSVIILDEFHAPTQARELGYVALYNALDDNNETRTPAFLSGKDLKVVVVTSYPQPGLFGSMFGLSRKQIDECTITISSPKSVAATTWSTSPSEPEYIRPAFMDDSISNRINTILEKFSQPKILVMIEGSISCGRIVIDKHDGVQTASLEDDDIGRVNLLTRQTDMAVIIFMVPDFGARVPVQGINHVICPNRKSLYYFRGIKKNTLICQHERLCEWEVKWAESHLDNTGTNQIYSHHPFPQISSRFPKISWPEVANSTEYWLGLIRINPRRALSDLKFARTVPSFESTQEALRQLICPPALLAPAVVGPPPDRVTVREQATLLTLCPDERTRTCLALMDRCGLDMQAALFLGGICQATRTPEYSSKREEMLVLASAIVVFGECPFLRLKILYGESDELSSLIDDISHLGAQESTDVRWRSDSSVNMAGWLVALDDDMRAKLLMENSKSKWEMDSTRLERGTRKIFRLARILGVSQDIMEELELGSFFKRMSWWTGATPDQDGEALDAHVFLMGTQYARAYQYNLMEPIQGERGRTGELVGSRKEVSLVGNYESMERRFEMRIDDRKRYFFCATRLMPYSEGKEVAQDLWVLHPDIVYAIRSEENQEIPGYRDLHRLLRPCLEVKDGCR